MTVSERTAASFSVGRKSGKCERPATGKYPYNVPSQVAALRARVRAGKGEA